MTTAHVDTDADSGRGSSESRVRRRNARGEGGRLREDIVVAAADMIAETGDGDRLTLRGVAKRVGIAAPSIYRHFADVEHLKLAVVERSFAGFAEARDLASRNVTDPVAALLARCRAYCRYAVDNPGPYRFLFSHRAPIGDPERPTAGMAAFQALAASIRRCQESGAARATEDATRLAALVWPALHGLCLLRMNVPRFPWPTPIEEMSDEIVARLVLIDAHSRPLRAEAPIEEGEGT